MTQCCSLRTVMCCTADMQRRFLFYHQILSEPELQAHRSIKCVIKDQMALKPQACKMRHFSGRSDRYCEQYLLTPYSMVQDYEGLGVNTKE